MCEQYTISPCWFQTCRVIGRIHLQGRWASDQLRWGGIDHMLLQGQPATTEACTSAAALSDSALNNWLERTSDQAMQRLRACHSSPPSAAAAATAARPAEPLIAAAATFPAAAAAAAGDAVTSHNSAQLVQLAAPARVSDSSTQHLPPPPRHHSHPSAATSGSYLQLATGEADLMPIDGDNALLGAPAESEAWFDSFEVGQHHQGSQRSTSALQSSAERSRCWAAPPPAQFPAMLRGTLAHAVLGGIAGKSLVNQVSRALQQNC